MLRVAEMAAQVASAEAHEDSGRSSVEAFALEGVEYFVYSKHGFLFLTKPTKPTKLFF